MSVVGVSRVGGELVERDMWSSFFMMLASLNVFLALFNLIPLPPLDGGHIAVVLYEKARDFFRKLRGLQPGGPADYTKLMPITLGVASILLAVGLLVIIADVVNPIRLFG
jgi:membrane-associated protease RseP (regulator of RpoE activity)